MAFVELPDSLQAARSHSLQPCGSHYRSADAMKDGWVPVPLGASLAFLEARLGTAGA